MVIIELVIAPHKLGEFISATRFKNIVRGDSERWIIIIFQKKWTDIGGYK